MHWKLFNNNKTEVFRCQALLWFISTNLSMEGLKVSLFKLIHIVNMFSMVVFPFTGLLLYIFQQCIKLSAILDKQDRC
jgi:hypothetical protein